MSYNSTYFDRKPGSLENAVLEALGGQINEASVTTDLDDDPKLFKQIERMGVKVKKNGKPQDGYQEVTLSGPQAKIDAANKKLNLLPEAKDMDKVNPDAVKKKFKDRKDKDIDNDGDVDSSDEYLHKRRKAVSKAIKSEGKLDEGKMKELAGKIASVYKKMKSDSKMKPFADKFRADVKKSLDIRKSLEKVLPDYVGGGDITKLMSEASELGTPERTKHTLDVTPGQSMEDWNKAVGVMQEKNDTMREALAKMWSVEESNNKNPFGEAADFKPHKMYDPKTGEAHDAKTMDDHLRMKKMGYTHTEPKKEQKTMTGQPATKVTVDPDMKEKKNIA